MEVDYQVKLDSQHAQFTVPIEMFFVQIQVRGYASHK